MGSLKSFVLAGVVALGAVSAHAADFPLAPPPPPPPPELKGTLGAGWYLRGDVGVGVTNVDEYYQRDVVGAGGSFVGSTENNTFFLGAGIGYRFNNWFRTDVTLEYRGGGQIGVNDRLSFAGAGGDYQLSNTYKGNLTSLVTLFNAYFDLGTWNCLTPYIGAGIGWATNRISGLTDQGIVSGPGFNSPTLGVAGTGDKSNLAWALMAGVGYEVNKNLTLEVGYRYLNLGDGESGVIRNAFLAESYAPLKAKTIDSHDFRIGMRWNFGDPNCCGPVAQPYEPPPVVVRKY